MLLTTQINQIQLLDEISLKYIKSITLSKANLSNFSLETISVNVLSITFNNCNLISLDLSLHSNLTSLNIQNNRSLKVLKLPNLLEILNLSNCNLTNFDFPLNGIKFLDLSHNKLEIFSQKSEFLVNLDLSFNSLQTFQVDNFPCLKTVSLWKNQIFYLISAKKDVEIDISSNQFKYQPIGFGLVRRRNFGQKVVEQRMPRNLVRMELIRQLVKRGE